VQSAKCKGGMMERWQDGKIGLDWCALKGRNASAQGEALGNARVPRPISSP